jgi:hypothetical protein
MTLLHQQITLKLQRVLRFNIKHSSLQRPSHKCFTLGNTSHCMVGHRGSLSHFKILSIKHCTYHDFTAAGEKVSNYISQRFNIFCDTNKNVLQSEHNIFKEHNDTLTILMLTYSMKMCGTDGRSSLVHDKHCQMYSSVSISLNK